VIFLTSIRRSIGTEALDSVREINAGGGHQCRFTSPEEIRQIRHGVGATQANFARMLGISLRTLQDWEHGRCRPNQVAQSLLAVAAQRPDVIHDVLA
jgi:putative transcriptional regulator